MISPLKIAEAGAVLHGPRWKSELARDLAVSERTLRRWVTGEIVPPHDLDIRLAALIGLRIQALQAVKHGIGDSVGR